MHTASFYSARSTLGAVTQEGARNGKYFTDDLNLLSVTPPLVVHAHCIADLELKVLGMQVTAIPSIVLPVIFVWLLYPRRTPGICPAVVKSYGSKSYVSSCSVFVSEIPRAWILEPY